MAFKLRKSGIELWRDGVAKDYILCFCCGEEVAPGDKGMEAMKPNKKIGPTGGITYTRNFLCALCTVERKEKPWAGVSEFSRFKIH